jgi:ATP-binding cassette, subfamily B, bacterial
VKKYIKTHFKLFLRFSKLLLPYKNKWILVLIFSSLSMVSGLVNPYLIKVIIDQALGNKDIKLLIILVVIGGGVFVLNGVFDGVRDYLEKYIREKINLYLNAKVYRCLQGFSFSYFIGRSTGENIYKISCDTERITDFIASVLPRFAVSFCKLFLILLVIFYLNWKITLFSILFAPFLYFPVYFFTRVIKNTWRIYIEGKERIFKLLQENFSHIQLIKIFGKESSSLKNFVRQSILNLRINIRHTKLKVFSSFFTRIFSQSVFGLIVFYGGYLVIKGETTVGALVAIITYMGQLMVLQSSFALSFQETMIGLVSCRRITDILDAPGQEKEEGTAKDIRFSKGKVIFKSVVFGYSPEDLVLDSMSFIIEGGSTIGLVGRSGCGKTTLGNLILRLYEPWEGSIFIDGDNIKDIRLKSLKEQIGMVLQEPFLFNDTIKNNITYGVGNIDKGKIIKVSEICGLHGFVKGLPLGYETVIGENACKISEGQKQRVSIARALIKSPRILILDEAMSSLDSASERKIMDNIKKYYADTTLIVISHRISEVLNVDLIYFFQSPGKMIIGKPKEILNKNRELVTLFNIGS